MKQERYVNEKNSGIVLTEEGRLDLILPETDIQNSDAAKLLYALSLRLNHDPQFPTDVLGWADNFLGENSYEENQDQNSEETESDSDSA